MMAHTVTLTMNDAEAKAVQNALLLCEAELEEQIEAAGTNGKKVKLEEERGRYQRLAWRMKKLREEAEQWL